MLKTKKRKDVGTGNEIPKGMRKKTYIFCFLMIIPALYSIFRYFYVNLNSIYIAFTITDNSGKEILSNNNFIQLFHEFTYEGSVLLPALNNTMKYFFTALLKIFISYIIAYFLYKKIKFTKFFCCVFFLPSIISPIISITIFKNIIGRYGPIWVILNKLFDVNFPEYLASSETATNLILIYVLVMGGFGSNFLILYGAMKRLPIEFMEAGQLDGANTWNEFWRILLPLTWDTLSTLILLHMTTLFTAGGPILYFTGGKYNTYTLSYWIFDQVRGGSYNYPSAIGLFFTLVGMPIVLSIRWFMNKINPEVSY